MVKLLQRFLLVLFLLIFTACANPYAGVRVDYDNPIICRFQNLPAECKIETKHFLFEYGVSKNEIGEYLVQGQAKHIGPSSWESYDGWFILHLVRGGIVGESFSFSMGIGDLGEPIEFKRKFSTPYPFDAVIIGYTFRITDASPC